MKIIRVIRTSTPLSIDIHPDSTMILPGRPFFLPDDGDERVARVHIAVRISRLGKNISKKFASRYYDGVSVGLRLTPAGNLPVEMQGVVSAMDSSTVTGEWIEPSKVQEKFEVNVAGEVGEVTGLLPNVDCAINEISKYMTLKMGDVILMPEILVTPGLMTSTRLTASMDGAEVLDLKVV